MSLCVSHSPDPLSIGIKQRRPLRGEAEDGVIVSRVLVIEVGRVEEVEALQGALHRQTEAGRAAPVARETTLQREYSGLMIIYSFESIN